MDSGKLIIRMPYILCFFVLCMLLAIPAHAQTTSLSGTVMDATGAAAPGASLTLTGISGAERTAVSNEAGFYRFVQLVPGKYTLRTELKGFKAAKQTFDLLVDTPMTVDMRLEVGEISETVTVEAEASMLNTQDAGLDLLTLQAGVTPDGYVSGARSDQTNLTLDGIDINEQQTGDWSNSVLRVSPDSVQEFKLTTNISNAAQGRSAGGQISLITRTGTNDFHGSLYYSNRGTWMTANDFFNNRSGLP
ncbi:MAG: carboxypeptidase-like regulatory domain-containing protein, partial [Acidobacteriota bacterium]